MSFGLILKLYFHLSLKVGGNTVLLLIDLLVLLYNVWGYDVLMVYSCPLRGGRVYVLDDYIFMSYLYSFYMSDCSYAFFKSVYFWIEYILK
jgi:hypothetical protein